MASVDIYQMTTKDTNHKVAPVTIFDAVVNPLNKKTLDQEFEDMVGAVPESVAVDDADATLVTTALRKTQQVLTLAEKKQARTNINAADADDLTQLSETVSENKTETDAKLSELGSKLEDKVNIKVSDVLDTPKTGVSLRIPIGQTLLQGQNYIVDIELYSEIGYIAQIGANPTGSGYPVDSVVEVFKTSYKGKVNYTPSVDVNYWYIVVASNYEYSANSYVSIKAYKESSSTELKRDIENINENIAEIGKNIDTINNNVSDLQSENSIIKEKVLDVDSNEGREIILSNHPAYSNIPIDFYLKSGSTFINLGVNLILANDSSLNGRVDVYNGQTIVLDSDKKLVRSSNKEGEVHFIYLPKNVISGYDILEDSIESEKIKNGAITVEKTSFIKSENLIDKNDSDVEIGAYINDSGETNPNSAYNVTGYIAVEEGKTYYIGSLDNGVSQARTAVFYDVRKNVIRNSFIQYVNNFIAPNGASYVRVSYVAYKQWDFAQITEGELKNYSEYKVVLKKEYMPQTNHKSGNTYFFLPKNIYVAVGRTIELYYDQILLGANKYNVKATCSVGKALERKYQIIGSESIIGSHTLTINFYDDNDNLVASGKSTINIVPSNINDSVKVLPIGDSLTNGKPWLNELSVLSPNISTIGTRLNKHEGRSGANVKSYLKIDGSIIYNYDRYYSGVGSDAEIFDEGKSYSKGEFVRKSTTFGNGQTGYDTYIFINDHIAGAWNDSDVYCLSGGNPFYDFNNNKFSMDFYKSFQNIDYNVIMIYLGTNGINLTPETNENGALGIKNLINLIREEDVVSPIVVVNTIFRSNQNGIGSQGNTDGYKAQYAYKFEEDKKVLLLGKAIEDMIGSMDNVYLCPVGFTHDSKYNFGNTHIQVNPRLSDTTEVYELQPSDSIHPRDCGYLQMADEMFSTICAIVNK